MSFAFVLTNVFVRIEKNLSFLSHERLTSCDIWVGHDLILELDTALGSC